MSTSPSPAKNVVSGAGCGCGCLGLLAVFIAALGAAAVSGAVIAEPDQGAVTWLSTVSGSVGCLMLGVGVAAWVGSLLLE